MEAFVYEFWSLIAFPDVMLTYFSYLPLQFCSVSNFLSIPSSCSSIFCRLTFLFSSNCCSKLLSLVITLVSSSVKWNGAGEASQTSFVELKFSDLSSRNIEVPGRKRKKCNFMNHIVFLHAAGGYFCVCRSRSKSLMIESNLGPFAWWLFFPTHVSALRLHGVN